MSLTVRKREEIWHARGTVRVGRDTVHVPEFSTGCRTRADAEAVAAAEEARIRAEHLDGPAGRAKRLTVADCFAAYLGRPGGVKPYDVARVESLNEAMGGRPLAEAALGWSDWLRGHPTLAPATAARWRTILLAALRAGGAAHGVMPPEIPTVRQAAAERVVVLAPDERRRLLAAYNPWASCPVLVLAYQGLRTQEALRMDWRHVDLGLEQIRVPGERTKSGRGRTVPMHPAVKEMLSGLWEAAGRPEIGAVFRSQRGAPYADTRGQGGNPLAQAHITACSKAGVAGFRVHDWQHDWAARMVMAGVDLYTLMRLGGWSSLRMVERYASVTAEHARAAVAKLA